MLNSREIGRLAGVSQATVSRVLQGSSLVAPPTRERVLAVVEATGYQPNRAARAMRTRRTGTVGIVLADLTNPFYPELLRALAAAIAARGLHMILWNAEGPDAAGVTAAVGQQLVDGLIFTGALSDTVALHEALDLRAPVVLVNRTVAGLPCDQVTSDNRATSARIARYFADNGHRRAALITAGGDASTARERSEGFLTGCREWGVTVTRRDVVDGGFTHAGGAAAMRRALSGARPPTAVFCVNDVSALGAVDAAAALGVGVPDDVWVVGYDDIDMASWESYALTTARQPLQDMASAAVDLLCTRIAHTDREPITVSLPSEVLVRRTTADVPLAPRTAEG
jgi:LacI family transcriptional regulator